MLVLALSCATTSAQLEREADTCESFAQFDERTRAQLEALLAEAPGEQLVKEASRLNTSRRTCARYVLSGLMALREARGVEAVQQELNALSATYRSDELRALMTQSPGADLVALEPLLLEARLAVNRHGGAARAAQRDERERAKSKVDAPESPGSAPEVPATMCDERSPCEQLKCVVEQGGSPEVAARGCLDAATSLEPAARARRAADVLALLPAGASPARTEATVMLETLRTQLWPQVDAALAMKQPGRAAQLASLFRSLAAVNVRVERLRDEAQAHHLARAKELAASPEAAWLHRRLAEDFGGPEAPPLGGTGKWEAARWRCEAPMPTLPKIVAGLNARLALRCELPKTNERKKENDPMHTFDLESSLKGQRLEGTLSTWCADRTGQYPVHVEEPGVEGFPEEALLKELERLLARAAVDCAGIHQLAATRSCAELSGKRTPAETIARFVEHARFLGRWAPCFEDWLIANEGVAPPAPPKVTESGP